MRRLPERPPELAAEVRARQAGGAREVVDAERLGVARVGEVLGAQQVACGRDEGHGYPRSTSSRRRIFPDGDLGISSTISTARMRL